MLHITSLLPWPATNCEQVQCVCTLALNQASGQNKACTGLDKCCDARSQQQQQGKQHHALSIENAGSRKFHISSFHLVIWPNSFPEHEFLVSKQRLHKINSYNSTQQTHLSCHLACHSSRPDNVQYVRDRKSTPGQVAAIRSTSLT